MKRISLGAILVQEKGTSNVPFLISCCEFHHASRRGFSYKIYSQPGREHLHALVVEQSWSKALARSAAIAGASRLSI
jgi:hypothetical protein